MRFKDVKLDDIKEYFDNNNYDCGLVHADYDEDRPNVLEIFRFDSEMDDEDTYICGVYRDNDKDNLIVETEAVISALNSDEECVEDEETSIETIIRMIMSRAKSGICEDIDFQKRQINFINDFCEKSGLEINSVVTTSGNTYE